MAGALLQEKHLRFMKGFGEFLLSKPFNLTFARLLNLNISAQYSSCSSISHILIINPPISQNLRFLYWFCDAREIPLSTST